MCRYGQYTYKERYACFDCKKSFKQTNFYELPREVRPERQEDRVVKCPQCAKQMVNMGHDFKPPKQNDSKQWLKVKVLYENGFTFHSCGCCGPGFRPKELNDVQAFLDDRRSKSEGELLLENIVAALCEKGITKASTRIN